MSMKSFGRAPSGEYTTFKSELVRCALASIQKGEVRFIEALRRIDLRLGQAVGILGRNGGKSTLLKLITGITRRPRGASRSTGASRPRWT